VTDDAAVRVVGLRMSFGAVRVRVLGLNPAAQPARLREQAGMVLPECGFRRQARVAELIDLWRSYYPSPRPLGDLLDPTFGGLPVWLLRLVATFLVKALAEVLQNAYAVRPFPAWDLANLALWTAAGAVFAVWRFRWHS
jgi:hypothetical protein